MLTQTCLIQKWQVARLNINTVKSNHCWLNVIKWGLSVNPILPFSRIRLLNCCLELCGVLFRTETCVSYSSFPVFITCCYNHVNLLVWRIMPLSECNGKVQVVPPLRKHQGCLLGVSFNGKSGIGSGGAIRAEDEIRYLTREVNYSYCMPFHCL